MAAKIGSAAAAVEEQLLAHGERFSYFQAIRLLRLFGKARGMETDSLRIRPKLSLGFPENDIDSIEPLPNGPAVLRFQRQDFQDQQVQCALHEVRWFAHGSVDTASYR